MTAMRDAECADVTIDLGGLAAALWRARARLLAFALLAAVAAACLVALRPSVWVSEARLLVDLADGRRARTGPSELDRIAAEDHVLAGQIALLTTPDLVHRAVIASGLADEGRAGVVDVWMRRLAAALGLRRDDALVGGSESLAAATLDGLAVERIERTRVLALRLSASDPERASRLLAALLDEHVAALAGARPAGSVDALRRLDAEIASVRDALAVAEARRDVPPAVDDGAAVRLDLRDDLAALRTRRAEIETRLDLLRRALRNDGRALETAAETAGAPALQRLRERRAALRARVAELSVTYLQNHPLLQDANAQLAEVQRQIRAELPRAVQMLEAEHDDLVRRQSALEARLTEIAAAPVAPAAEGAGELLSRVRTGEIDALRARLDDLLARRPTLADEAAGRSGPDVHVLAPPSWPSEPASLRPTTAAVAAALLAALLAAIHTLWRDVAGTVRARLAAPPPAPPLCATAFAEPPVYAGLDEAVILRLLPDVDPGPWVEPARAALETLRAAPPSAADAGRRIVVTSASDDDAAHAAALALLRVAAATDAAVCLVDLCGSLAETDAPDLAGLSDLLAGAVDFSDVVHRDPGSRGHLVPAGTAPLDPDGLDHPELGGVLEALGATYDDVVLDLGLISGGEGVAALLFSAGAVVLAALDAADPATSRARAALEAAGRRVVLLVAAPADADTEVDFTLDQRLAA